MVAISRAASGSSAHRTLFLIVFNALNVLMILLLIGPWLAPIMLRASNDGTSLLHTLMGFIARMVYTVGVWVCPERNLSFSILDYPFIVCIRCFDAGLGLVSASALYAVQYRWAGSLPFRIFRPISFGVMLLFVLPWVLDAATHLLGFWSGTVELRIATAWLGGLGIGMFAYGLIFGEPARLKAMLLRQKRRVHSATA